MTQLGEGLNWQSSGHRTSRWEKSWTWLQAAMCENFLLTAAKTIHGIMPPGASTAQEWITRILNITDLKVLAEKLM